ncbi:MAG TPA: PrsW family intramembrane metalloprotease [Anaerolineae bacterium]
MGSSGIRGVFTYNRLSMSAHTVFALSTIATVVPTIFYVGIIYWFDRYEKEPWWLLTAAFLWGAIPSIIIAFSFNTLFSIPLYLVAGDGAGEALAASLIAPPVEETIKGAALLAIFFWWRDEIDSPLDGIIYGAMVGVGFAMVENVFYFVNVYNEGGPEAWGLNIFMRGIIFGLNHALFSSMTGLGIAIARMATSTLTRFLAPLLGWTIAMFLHFLHNASVSFGNLLCLVALVTDWGGVWLTVAIIVWALLQERRWIREYLVEEVRAGTLTLSQYETACSGRKRIRHNIRLLFSRGPRAYGDAARFFQRCSKLAYRKHHFKLFGDGASRQHTEQLRIEISDLSHRLLFGD